MLEKALAEPKAVHKSAETSKPALTASMEEESQRRQTRLLTVEVN